QIVSTPTYRITTRTVNTSDCILENHNHFLDLFPGADGVKTGYVRQSGRCLVATATHSEGTYPWRLLAIALNSKDPYVDCAAMLDFGFKNFQPVFFARQGQEVGKAKVSGSLLGQVPVVAASDMIAVVPRGTPAVPRTEVAMESGVHAPLKADQVVGTLFGYLN